MTAPVGETAGQVSTALLQLVNEERAKHDLPALRRDGKLTALARSHTRDMIKNRFFGHRSPVSGDMDARVEAAGIRALVIGENIARGENSLRIHRSLMGSPGHRANILRREFTHVGISAIADPQPVGTTFAVTQLFAAYPKR